VAFIQDDLREPEAIPGDPAVAKTLGLTRPVGLGFIGVMHHLRDEDDPPRVVATLVDALAPGSYLVLSQTTPDFDPDAMGGLAAASEQGGIPTCPLLRRHRAVLRGPGAGQARPRAARGLAARPGAEQDPRSVYAYGGSSASPEATLLGLRRMAGCDFCC
jgi:S-adenosyl methyltransferase